MARNFRPRPLPLDEPLMIIRKDLEDEAIPHRSVPDQETGMEKEEEQVDFFFKLFF